MSGFGAIYETTLELRRQIFEALETTADADFGLDGNVDRISVQSPGAELDDSAVASLYLYRLELDEHLRNQRLLPDADEPDLFRRPPVPLQLCYLFTPVHDSEETNQLLLGRVLQHFHDSPCFATFSGEPIGRSHGGASPELRVLPDTLPLEQATQIWTAFSAPYRVAVFLRVEVLALDSARPPQRLPRSHQLATATGQGRRSS